MLKLIEYYVNCNWKNKLKIQTNRVCVRCFWWLDIEVADPHSDNHSRLNHQREIRHNADIDVCDMRREEKGGQWEGEHQRPLSLPPLPIRLWVQDKPLRPRRTPGSPSGCEALGGSALGAGAEYSGFGSNDCIQANTIGGEGRLVRGRLQLPDGLPACCTQLREPSCKRLEMMNWEKRLRACGAESFKGRHRNRTGDRSRESAMSGFRPPVCERIWLLTLRWS